MNYFVSPAAKTDLRIDPTQLATALKSQWHEVEIHPIKIPRGNILWNGLSLWKVEI
jgi:hypothetical protein